MLKFIIMCLVFMGIGGIAIWRGKSAIRNRHMSNSLKSSFITGVTEITGDNAVKMGKISFILGIIISSISGLVLLIGIGFSILGTALNQPPSSYDSMRDRDFRRGGEQTIEEAMALKESNNRDASNDHDEEPRRARRNRRNAPPVVEDKSRDNSSDDDWADDEDNGLENQMIADANERMQEAQDSFGGDFGRQENNSRRRRSQSSGRDGRNSRRGDNSNGIESGAPENAATTASNKSDATLPQVSFSLDRTRESNLVGFNLHQDVTAELSPDGGILVGATIFQSDRGLREIVGIQPVFQIGDQYSVGKTIGVESGDEYLLRAPAGYVVHRIDAVSGVGVNGLKLGFIKMNEEGRLLKQQTDFSDWIGNRHGKKESINSRSKVVVGLTGGFRGSGELAAIGFVTTSSLQVADSNKKHADEPTNSAITQEEFETWKSSNGKHTIEAKFVKQADGMVHLEKKDGKIIKVKISALGKDEQDRLTSREQ